MDCLRDLRTGRNTFLSGVDLPGARDLELLIIPLQKGGVFAGDIQLCGIVAADAVPAAAEAHAQGTTKEAIDLLAGGKNPTVVPDPFKDL